jgi:hypothetical protein
MRFSDYFYNVFLEKRSTPKQYVVDQLEKYKDDPDVFISFTMDLGGPKLGLNPKSTYGTPLGIYSYPLKIMWHDIKSYWNIPFAKEHPNIFVFKPKDTSKIVYSSKYDFKDLEKDFPDFPKQNTLYISREHSPEENEQFFKTRYAEIPPDKISTNEARAIGFITRQHEGNYTEILRLAQGYFPTLRFVEKPVPPEDTLKGFIKKNISPDHQKNPAQIFLSMCRLIAKENPIRWSKEILNHGYTGVFDDDGTGIIHINEPTQAVFFRTRDLQILDLIKNKGTNNWNREKPDQGLI